MSVLDAARALAPTLAERAGEAEAARTLPADVVEQLRAAGVFHMAMPTGLGGPPLEPATIVQVIEELSAADGSAGWTSLIGNSTAFVAWLDPDVAKEILAARPDAVAAGSFAPGGNAVPDGSGAFTVSGRWPFTSGAPHADWLVNGVIVMDGDMPRMRDGRYPDWRFAWIPATDIQVEDTWHAAGLRGTGSHHTSAAGIRVREEHTAAPLFDPARADDALFRFPFFSLLMTFFAGFPLGVARRARDEFVTLAQTKSRRTDGSPLTEDETVQVEMAHVDGLLGSARAFVFDAVQDLYDTVVAGDPPAKAQRARVALAVQHAMRSGVQVVDTTFRLGGGGALFDSSPLQRCFRDLHAGAQHIALSLMAERTVGRTVLGLEPNSILF
jgi:alkylation response protein AidB-like acyl-CoA dehydrogenase